MLLALWFVQVPTHLKYKTLRPIDATIQVLRKLQGPALI